MLGQVKLVQYPTLGQADKIKETILIEATDVDGNPIQGIPFNSFKLSLSEPLGTSAVTDEFGLARLEVQGGIGENLSIGLSFTESFKYGLTPATRPYTIGQKDKRLKFIVQKRLISVIPPAVFYIGGAVILGALILPPLYSWIFKKGK